MKQPTTVLCLLLFLLFSGMSFVSGVKGAQVQNELTPIYSGSYLSNFYWSPDSSHLVFNERGFEAGVVLKDPDYFQFDVVGRTLTRSNVWHLQPSLTSQEQQVYMPYTYPPESTNYANENDFMFLSPNQRYMIYVADPENPSLAIADRQTVTTHIFNVPAGNTLETDFFFALWSANSESVLVGNNPILGDFPRYFYISNFATDVQNATIQELPGTVELGGNSYSTGFVEDINSDGTILLTSPTSLESLYQRQLDTRLATFTPSDMNIQTLFENTRVYDQNILAAAFDPIDERYLLALTDTGIQRYNTVTNTWTTLNSDVNSTWVDYALFSPDGRHLVVEHVTDRNNSLSDVYVIDLTQLPPPPDEARAYLKPPLHVFFAFLLLGSPNVEGSLAE